MNIKLVFIIIARMESCPNPASGEHRVEGRAASPNQVKVKPQRSEMTESLPTGPRRGRPKGGRGAQMRSSHTLIACSRRCARSALSRRTLVFLFSSVSVPKKKSTLAERMRGLAWQI